jgi:hypothetical protein
MSHYRLKTKYNTEGPYGSIDEDNTVYAHHELSCDYVSFYYGDGEFIMDVPGTIDNNILEAINKLYKPFKKERGFIDGVEPMDKEDCDKCFKQPNKE